MKLYVESIHFQHNEPSFEEFHEMMMSGGTPEIEATFKGSEHILLDTDDVTMARPGNDIQEQTGLSEDITVLTLSCGEDIAVMMDFNAYVGLIQRNEDIYGASATQNYEFQQTR